MMMKYKPMLAHPVGGYERIKDEDWPLYSQYKLDGVRCVIQAEKLPFDMGYDVVAYSRTGKEWKNIRHILEDLRPFFQKHPNVVLDGELYNHKFKDDFEQIISMVRKTKPTDYDRKVSKICVQFHCYDMINRKMNFKTREAWLWNNLPTSNCIKTVPSYRVDDTEEVDVYHEKSLNAGYEGSILRKDKPYECKRSFNLLKVKDFFDTEATIVGFVEGKGKRKGTVGKFIAEDKDGVMFGMPVMDKFKYLQDNFKAMQGWIGKTATFTYFERTKAGSYRHPLFKCIRNYE